ncbi:Highly reducing polyketide synthase gloL [Colletotrichum spinosum]|uniref:Highly reducing polyketide synthase gloL n=1 Tax=Colletotrichum spinosum TaxID=1347390 RepID=A0A4R8Q2Y9_9PEZI|nr:Highly reducing polyketide synthase gloL [Colletotrichum spinosum]
MADSSDIATPAPVAICGIGLRLPGGINTPTSLYNFLISRKDARSKRDVPRYESKHHYFTGTGKSGSLPTEEGYWLSNDDVTKFDPSMFSMSPKETAKLDPQQRLLLQVVWEALESAAETDWQGQKIGCYVGSFGDDWREMHAVDTQDDGMYRLTGYMDFAQANRVSHAFDLRGPSMTVRTACSAGGLAVHLACQAIRAGECDSAVVAGSNLMLSPGFTKLMAEQSVLSPDASCKTFDASADGYARAEAVNCLFLKKLDAAIRDGNPIRAVIRGSATNSDGKTLGLTTPSAQAQQELIRDAYRQAGIPEKDMWQTAMVECHGTGTAVGDTIEANTVGTIFGEKGMIIGSVKPNLGHSEAASALTSIVKAVLSLETRTIIPNIKFETPSISIPFASAGLKVPTEPMPWPEDRAERIGINSFGIGGTNVHIIVESAGSSSGRTAVRGPGNVETPPPSPPLRREPATLLVFSAAHEESLKNMVDSYKHFVDAQPSRLEALSHTLTHRRQHLGYRSFTVVTDDCESLVFNQPALPSFKANTQASGIAFVFTGQGAHWARMGSHLLKGSQEFLQDIREMDSVLKSLPREHCPTWDIRTELMRPEATSRLGEAEFAQPICTALQIALVRHFARYGVTPKAVAGHSSGEIAAAYAAGALTLKEAIIVAYYRGYTAKKLNKQGAMAAVGLGRVQVTPFLVDGVGIACENSNASVTLSGDVGALGGVCNAIKAAKPDALVRMLKVDKAYHSHHMRAVGAKYQALIKPHLKPSPPKIAFYSSVSSAKLDRGSDFGPEYWQRNLESPVLFRQAVTSLLQTSSAALHLEVGPHSALAGPLKQIYTENAISPPYLSALKRDSFLRSVETTRWYRAMAKVGYNYGPLFRGMRTIKASVSSPAAAVEISDDRDVEGRIPSNYSIHPRTVDQVLQSLIVAFHSGQPRLINKLYLPTSIDEVFVSKSKTSATFDVSTLSTGTMGSFQGDSVGNMNGKPVFFMKGLCFSPVELQESVTDQASDSKAVQMSWKPDIDLVKSATLVSSQADASFPDVHKLLENLFILCGAATVDDLAEIGDLELDGQPHLKKHFEWLKRHISTSKSDRTPTTHKRLAEIERVFSELQMTPASSAATLIKRCYTHARSLFTSRLSPLELFLQDNALHELYDWMNTLFSYKDLFQLLSHKHGRHFRILEIGAGTGGLTARILRDLVACFDNGKSVGRYVFTDVSAGFFPAAKKRFEAIPAGFLDYRVLDINRDPEEQGFSGEKYDLIVASNVLHATPDLTQTLRHARSLLKPNGRLLMHELCCETKWINWIMGHLAGWWLGEANNRPEEPYISPEQWTERLLAAGFSAPDVFYDGKSKDKLNATIIARPALQDAVSPASKTITLLTEDSQDHAVLAKLRTTFEEKGYTVSCAAIGSDAVALAGVVVSAIDLCRGDGYFHDMTEAKLDAFKALLRTLQEKSAKLFWLTRACQVNPSDPTYAPVLGVARTARVELGVSLATFEVDVIDGGGLEAICRTVDEAFYNNQSLTEQSADMEFSYSSGQTLIPRCNWTPISHSLQALTPASATKSLQITRPGALQTLRWTSRDLTTTLAPDSVRIRVHAAGLNFKDVVTAMGLITPSAPSGLGCEASGVVTQIGSTVTSLRLGDRVMVFAPQAACSSTDIHAPAQLCVRIPKSLSFGDAAGMPCIFVTVLRALVDKAGLTAGQTVLIHSAAGGVGIAAMQIARWIGAKVFATVGSEDKKDFLVREWGLPRESIFCSRDTSFVQGVKAATDGRGVDVVLNSLSGELLHASWECVAPHGTFVELGKRDTLAGGKLAMAAFDDNRSFIGVEMANLAAQDPSIVSRLLEQCVELYEKGVIAPVRPLCTFACGKIEDAVRYLYKGTHIGKVVIDLSDDALSELDDVRPTPVPVFRSDAAYMLVGGMGGLGSSIARWMASHGARDITFLSRSAGTKSDDHALLAELQGMGVCTAAISCDIGDEEAVRAIISKTSSEKKIAGVINLAMVLSDSAMSSMTLPQWQAATSPKIRGTWNLHRVLPADMDFFVLFGSVSGVHGYPGQANYAATNTFLDSFAQYRRGLGLACSVVDLGGVEDVGYVSRAQDVEDAMRKAGAKLVSESDMLMGLQLAIAQSRPTSQGDGQGAFSGQVVVGLDCTVSIGDSRNRVIWKQDPRMVLYPDENEVSDESQGEPGASGMADFVSYLQSHPQELDAPATMARLSREIALRVFGFLMREVDEDGIDTSLSPSALGVDSLMTIEIRNWWKHTIGAEVSVLQLTSAQSFDQLGQLAASQLQKKMASGKQRS